MRWFCSCGCGIVGDPPAVDAFRRDHVKSYPGHWEVTSDEWSEQACAHCPCFDHEPDGQENEPVACCKCGDPYQPMTEIGGRRVFIKDALGGPKR
jgi:hypothetical protein